MLFEFKIVCHVHSPPPGNAQRVVRTRKLLPYLVVASVELMIQTQEAPNGGTQGAPMNDLVDHTMLQAELGGTRIFRQMLVHELFKHPRSGEADDGPWLRQDYVAEHGKAGGHPTSGRVRQQREVGHAALAETRKGGRGLVPLHRRSDRSWHEGAAG